MGKFKHGLTGTRLYRIWKAMKRRCNNPNLEAYKNYGGRGIKVCKEWDVFSEFHNWAIRNGYSDDLTIDRIDNDDDYNPFNCRWVSRRVQSYNQRETVFVELHGNFMTFYEISKLTKIAQKTLRQRYIRGDRDERLIRPLTNRGRNII